MLRGRRGVRDRTHNSAQREGKEGLTHLLFKQTTPAMVNYLLFIYYVAKYSDTGYLYIGKVLCEIRKEFDWEVVVL